MGPRSRGVGLTSPSFSFVPGRVVGVPVIPVPGGIIGLSPTVSGGTGGGSSRSPGACDHRKAAPEESGTASGLGKIIRQFRRLVGGLQKIGITGEQTVLEKGRQLTVRHLGKLEQTTLTVETLEVRVVQGKGLNDRRTEGWGQVIHEDGNGIQAHGRAKAQFLFIRDRANGQVSSSKILQTCGSSSPARLRLSSRQQERVVRIRVRRSEEGVQSEITVIDPQIEVLDGMGGEIIALPFAIPPPPVEERKKSP